VVLLRTLVHCLHQCGGGDRAAVDAGSVHDCLLRENLGGRCHGQGDVGLTAHNHECVVASPHDDQEVQGEDLGNWLEVVVSRDCSQRTSRERTLRVPDVEMIGSTRWLSTWGASESRGLTANTVGLPSRFAGIAAGSRPQVEVLNATCVRIVRH
jgi:hypothetical protein